MSTRSTETYMKYRKETPYTTQDSVTILHLTSGPNPVMGLIDTEDMDVIDNMPWSIIKTPRQYVGRAVYREGGTPVIHYLHRAIMEKYHGSIGGLVPHHINNNGLDNRKVNLMLVSQRQNVQLGHRARKPGKLLGVNQWGKRWVARVIDKNKQWKQYFNTREEAAMWYDLICVKIDPTSYYRLNGLGLNYPEKIQDYVEMEFSS